MAQIVTTIPSMLWIATTANPMNFLPSIASQTQIYFIVGMYLVVALGYSIPVSLLQKPKRIISPLNIQLGTVGVFGLVMLTRFLIPFTNYGFTMMTYIQFALSWGFFYLIFFTLFGIVGFYQTLFVRWWIGVNLVSLSRQTFRINANFAKVRKQLLTENFVDFFHFRIREDSENLLILKRAGRLNVVLALTPELRKERSILAVIAYELSLYAMESTPPSLELRDNVVFNLRGRMQGSAFTTHTNETMVMSLAYAVAMEPAKSKFERVRGLWENIPRYFQYAIATTLSTLVVLVPLVYYFQSQLKVTFEFGFFFELEVLISLALMAEIGLGAREELTLRIKRRRRIE